MASQHLTINALLEEAGLDLVKTKLARHGGGGNKIDHFGAWLERRVDFEQYQSIQVKPVFDGADHLASFAVDPTGKTVFLGIYRVRGRLDAPVGEVERLTSTIIQPHDLCYDLVLIEALAEYRGRLVIDWGLGFIKWVQGGKNIKPITELRRQITEPAFPGYHRFTTGLAAVPTLPATWRGALEQVRGAYVLTHVPTKQLYVGSAYGGDGFYSRWLKHAKDPDPIGLKELQVTQAAVSILEVTAAAWGEAEALDAEAHWKRILQPALNYN